MNHCPYHIGGSAHGTAYLGPIGKILLPHLLGSETTHDLPTACTMYGTSWKAAPKILII